MKSTISYFVNKVAEAISYLAIYDFKRVLSFLCGPITNYKYTNMASKT